MAIVTWHNATLELHHFWLLIVVAAVFWWTR